MDLSGSPFCDLKLHQFLSSLPKPPSQKDLILFNSTLKRKFDPVPLNACNKYSNNLSFIELKMDYSKESSINSKKKKTVVSVKVKTNCPQIIKLDCISLYLNGYERCNSAAAAASAADAADALKKIDLVSWKDEMILHSFDSTKKFIEFRFNFSHEELFNGKDQLPGSYFFNSSCKFLEIKYELCCVVKLKWNGGLHYLIEKKEYDHKEDFDFDWISKLNVKRFSVVERQGLKFLFGFKRDKDQLYLLQEKDCVDKNKNSKSLVKFRISCWSEDSLEYKMLYDKGFNSKRQLQQHWLSGKVTLCKVLRDCNGLLKEKRVLGVKGLKFNLRELCDDNRFVLEHSVEFQVQDCGSCVFKSKFGFYVGYELVFSFKNLSNCESGGSFSLPVFIVSALSSPSPMPLRTLRDFDSSDVEQSLKSRRPSADSDGTFSDSLMRASPQLSMRSSSSSEFEINQFDKGESFRKDLDSEIYEQEEGDGNVYKYDKYEENDSSLSDNDLMNQRDFRVLYESLMCKLQNFGKRDTICSSAKSFNCASDLEEAYYDHGATSELPQIPLRVASLQRRSHVRRPKPIAQ